LWGQYNRPFTSENSARCWPACRATCRTRRVRAGLHGGADPSTACYPHHHAKAWHSLFARTMLQKVRGEDALRRHVPEFTVIAAPGFQASPIVDSTRSEAFIIINFRERLAIIGGTNYAGEIKKTIFTVLNFCCRCKACCRCTARPTSAPTAMSQFSLDFQVPARRRCPPTRSTSDWR